MLKVTDAKYVKDYIVWLQFSDGAEGEVDLKNELFGEVFVPLRDKEFFKQFLLHPDWLTITWPNGADFAPEFLHAAIQVHA